MKFFARKQTQRVTNFVLAAMLVVSTLAASVPFIFAQNANAATTVTVTSTNTQGWTTDDTRSNGHVSFVPDTSNGSTGALSLKTDAAPVAGQDKAQYMKYFASPVALSDVTGALSFDTKQNSAIFASGTPSYQIPVFLNGTTGTNFATLVYEPYVDQGNAAVINGIWQHWNINYTSSKFYSTKTFTGQAGSVVASQGSSTYTLEQIKQYFPNAVVLGFGLNIGSNNPGYDTEADNFTFNDTTYNFDYTLLSAPTNLTPADNTYTTNTAFDNTWDGVTGAVKYEYITSYTLGGNPQTYTDTSDAGNYVLGGSTITRHNSGTPESTYTWKVRAIDANGVPGVWSAEQDVTVDTTAPTKPVLALPSNGSTLTTNEFDFDWNDSTDASPLTYEFQSSQSPSRDANDVLNGSNIWSSGPLPSSMIHSSGAGDGAWFYQVRAKDAAGNYSAWSDIWAVVLDTQKPAAPTVGATGFTASGQSTNNGSVEITWNTPSSDTAKYDYRVWTNASGSIYNSEASAYQENGLTGNARTGAFSEGEGSYFVQVRAIDGAGNASDWSQTFVVIYDATAPGITVNAAQLNTDVPTFTGTTDDSDAVITVTINGVTYQAVVTEQDWTVTGDALPVGEYVATVNAHDTTGNESPAQTVAVSVVAEETDPGDGDTPVTTNNTPTPTPVTTTITPIITNPAAAVLGATTDDSDDTSGAAEVKGTNDEKVAAAVNSDANQGKVFGLAWYWWILIIAALATIAGFIAAAIRRRNDENA